MTETTKQKAHIEFTLNGEPDTPSQFGSRIAGLFGRDAVRVLSRIEPAFAVGQVAATQECDAEGLSHGCKRGTVLALMIERRIQRFGGGYRHTRYLTRIAQELPRGDTPLILAARVGFTDAVRWLLDDEVVRAVRRRLVA